MLKMERACPVSGHGDEPITGDREWRNHGGCPPAPGLIFSLCNMQILWGTRAFFHWYQADTEGRSYRGKDRLTGHQTIR